MLSPLCSLLLALIVVTPTLPLAADDALPLGDRIATGVEAMFAPPKHLELTVKERKPRPRGATVMIGGVSTGTPFTGAVDVVLKDQERTLVSRSALPGFGAVEVAGRKARVTSYEEESVEFEPLLADFRRVCDRGGFRSALAAAEWSEPAGSPAVSVASLPPGLFQERGGARMPIAARVIAVRAQVTLAEDGSIAALHLEIDRNDPMSGLIGRQFGGGTGGGEPQLGSTRTLHVRPAATELGSRAQRVRLELLASLAAKERGEEIAPASAREDRARPSTPPVSLSPREQAKRRFEATISRVDRDGDGQISETEAGDRWERLKKYDADGDAKIDLSELLAAYDRRNATPARDE